MDEVTAGMNTRPTLKDIAHTAGVSISTVSIVLSGKASERRISPRVVVRGPLFYAKIRAVFAGTSWYCLRTSRNIYKPQLPWQESVGDDALLLKTAKKKSGHEGFSSPKPWPLAEKFSKGS